MYHWFVRPKWITKKYIHDHVRSNYRFDGRFVLDFGSGTGANCPMFHPNHYLGVDPDAERIGFARRIYPDHRFHVLDGKEFPLPDKTVDFILIVAVLHHIAEEEIANYMKEFHRILKPTGTIIVMEPCLCEKYTLCNRFMQWYDEGDYIRDEEGYLRLFRDHDYDCTVIKRFRKCFFYNELFFSTTPK